jgi:hypothetical protein
MRTKAALLIGSTALALVGSVAALTISQVGKATAASSPVAVQPAVQADGHAFFTDAQIDAAWSAATTNYPLPLPSGVDFPVPAPAFFHPNDGKQHVFEQNLPAEIAASYWKCAWLNVANTASTDTAATLASTELADYANLPGVAGNVDLASQEADISAYAQSQGETTDLADFQINCSGFYNPDGVSK